MVEWLLKIDYWLFEKINHAGVFSFGDIFFPWVTDLNKSKVFAIIAIPLVFFLYFKKYGKKGAFYFLILLVSIGFNDFVGGKIKNHYARLRPFDNPEIMTLQKSAAGGKSFYSNHASNLFTFATYSSQFFPQLSVPFFVAASLVGYSRIYNGVHYPSDVLAGAIAGIFWGFIFSYLAKRFVLKYGRKEENL